MNRMATLPNAADARAASRESWYVAALTLLLFIAGSWQQPFINFESRFALFAQEMLRHGPSLFPTTYGQPYPDYPVTGTLLIWLCSLPFGAVTKFSAVLPTAVASAASSMLLYRLLAPFSRQWAVLALCLQVMTATFLAEARSVSLDQLLALVTMLAFYCAYTAQVQQNKLQRWLPLIVLAGFAVRGPLGVVIPAAVVCALYASRRDWRACWRFGLLSVLLLIAAWGSLLAAAAAAYDTEFMRSVVYMQVFGRLETRSAPEPFYYFSSSLGNYALAYPLAIVVGVAMLRELRLRNGSEARRLLIYLLAWVAIVIIGLSIPHVKKARYLLPIVPALAAIAAYPWLEAPTRFLQFCKQALEKVFALLPLLLAIALAVLHHRAKHHHDGVHLSMPPLYAALSILQIVAAWSFFKLPTTVRAMALAASAALAIWLVAAFAVEPVQRQLHDTADFVARAEALRAQRPAPLAMFGIAKDGQAIKYLVNTPYDLAPLFAGDTAELAALPRPLYIMVEDRNLPQLSSAEIGQPVLQAKFDGRPFSLMYFP